MLDDLRALAVFARIVELGSIRGAARSLSLSPSVVSHHLRSLEERVGTALLYRTTRRIALTPAGERLVRDAQAMVACAERGLSDLHQANVGMRGTLRVTMAGFLAATHLPQFLTEFARAHPNVSLSVSFTELPRDLVEDKFDLALRMGDVGDSTHLTRLLCEMPRALVGPAAPWGSPKPPRAPEDLAKQSFVHLASRRPVLRVRHAVSGKEAVVHYEPRISADSAIAVRALTLAGAGIATLPRVLVEEDIAQGRLVEVLRQWEVAPVPVRAIWPHTTVKATLTSLFLDFIAPRVAEMFQA